MKKNDAEENWPQKMITRTTRKRTETRASCDTGRYTKQRFESEVGSDGQNYPDALSGNSGTCTQEDEECEE